MLHLAIFRLDRHHQLPATELIPGQQYYGYSYTSRSAIGTDQATPSRIPVVTCKGAAVRNCALEQHSLALYYFCKRARAFLIQVLSSILGT